MARAILITGGNRGNVKPRLREAQQLINRHIGAVMRCSHSYESSAWGFESPERFVNQVLEVDTDLKPEELLEAVHRIERQLGRNREEELSEKERTGQRYASRPIDIDILFYDDRILTLPDLVIPHPGIPGREFVLVPLCEIMRDRRHPLIGLTMGELLAELKRKKPCACER